MGWGRAGAGGAGSSETDTQTHPRCHPEIKWSGNLNHFLHLSVGSFAKLDLGCFLGGMMGPLELNGYDQNEVPTEHKKR